MADDHFQRVLKLAQECFSSNPVVILGSGASAAFGISGMPQLADHLKSSIDLNTIDARHRDQWTAFCNELDSGVGLETALHKVELVPDLTARIVMSSWSLINGEDLVAFRRSLSQPDLFPLTTHILTQFRATNREVHVVTTNYDRLAEYACDRAGYPHHTGFSHGYIRSDNARATPRYERVVRIWKVHGSLDWYTTERGERMALTNLEQVPPGCVPIMVTPGRDKYRKTQMEPCRTIVAQADQALERAVSYLCIGYGFNDDHIQEKMLNRCDREHVLVVMLAKRLTDAAKTFLTSGRCKRYLACEEADGGSVCYTDEVPGGVKIEGRDCWSHAGFLKLVM